MKSSTKINYLSNPMGVGEIISRAWRIYRVNFLKVFTYSFLLIIILASIGVLTKPHEIPFLIIFPTYLFKFPEIAVVALIIIHTLFNFIFLKLFHNCLCNKPTNITAILRPIKLKFSSLFKYVFLYLLEITIFIIIDIFLFIGIGFIVVTLISAVESKISYGNPLYDLFMMVMMFGFILYMLIFFLLFVCQLFFCLMQFVSVVLEDIPVKFSLVRSFEVVFNNPLRFLLFSLILSTLCLILYMNLHGLLYLILNLIITVPLIKFNVITKEMYFVDSCIDLLGFCAAIAFVWPLLINSLAFYFLDRKIRDEGIDLYENISSEKESFFLNNPEEVTEL